MTTPPENPYGASNPYADPNPYGSPASPSAPNPYGTGGAGIQDASTQPMYGSSVPQRPYATPGATYAATYASGHYAPYATTSTSPNTLSIVAFVCSLAGLVTYVSAVAGIICGHIALNQMRRSNDPTGRGFAVASLVIGYTIVALGVAAIVLFFLFIAAMSSAGY